MPGATPHQVARRPDDPGHPFGEIAHARMRAFLVAYSETGSKAKACDIVGFDRRLIYTRMWRDDQAFQEAMDRAYIMASDQLEAEARRRAVEGVKQYKFNRHGESVRHPTICECGHGLDLHPRPQPPQSQEKAFDGAGYDEDVEGGVADDWSPHRPCTHPDCAGCVTFIGEPYYEHAYSDKLLTFLLTGALPKRYATKRVEFKGLLANLDINRLPDHLIDRIADGANPVEVLAAAADEALALGITPAEHLGIDVPDQAALGAGDEVIDL